MMIVHIGVGGFHRAHQAVYLDELRASGLADDWAICGVGVLPGDARMRDALRARDFKYTVVVRHPDGSSEVREIGSIVEYLFAPDDPDAVVERMSDPEVRIVSLTVTEGGYHVHPVTGEFDPSHPDIAADREPGAVPRTAFGLIAAALRRRRARGVPPFTVLSCDNIQSNGDVARRMLTAFAPDIGPDVAFPNSMVDRITPALAEAERTEVAAAFGLDEPWPVVTEPFRQWVIEDHFPTGRPPWEEAGAQLVADVEPYELMKLRLLNASHQGLCYFGRLLGHVYVHDAARDPDIVALLRDYMAHEAVPTLPEVPGVDLAAYQETLLERFGNPHVRDTIARLCTDSSDRIPTWLLPVVRANLANGGPIECSAAIVASWARYAEGVDEGGEPIEVVDRRRDSVMAAAAADRFLQQPELFGDLATDERFVTAYGRALDSLRRHGARVTLAGLAAR